jgi:hypothetical protein
VAGEAARQGGCSRAEFVRRVLERTRKELARQPAKRVLGGARGLIVEIDPDWWKPMTDEEVKAFYRGDY